MKKLLTSVAAIAACVGVMSAGSINDIMARKVVKIGLQDHSAPFAKMSSGGGWEGFEPDFAQELVKKMFPEGDVKIEFVAVKGSERMDAVTGNQVDMLIAGFARTAAREKLADFSLPYISTELAMVTPKTAGVKSLGDLNGKNIGVLPNSNSEIYLQKDGNFNIVECHNNKECLDMLNSGSIDGYMHNLNNVATIPLLNDAYEVSIPMIGEGLMDCVVTQKGNSELINKINDAILALAQEHYFSTEYDKTFEPFFRGAVKREYFVLDDVYEMLY